MSGSSPVRVLAILAGVFLLVGLGFVAAGGVVYASTASFLSAAEQTTGTVVALAGGNGRDRTWSPVVEFTVDGQAYEVVGRTGSNPPAHDVGDSVTVAYDPARPADARIVGFAELYLLPVIFGSIGASFFLTAVVLGGVGLRNRRRLAQLRQFGRSVHAEVVRVTEQTNVRINGRHPWVVHASWRDPFSGEDRIARSSYLRSDPRPGIDVGHEVRVLVDPERPKRHVLDLPD